MLMAQWHETIRNQNVSSTNHSRQFSILTISDPSTPHAGYIHHDSDGSCPSDPDEMYPQLLKSLALITAGRLASVYTLYLVNP